MPDPKIRDGWPLILLVAATLTVSSSRTLSMQLDGRALLVGLALAGAFVLYTAFAWLARRVLNSSSRRLATTVSVGVVLLLVSGFAVIYPREGAPQGDGGSDQDDAINILSDHLGSLSSPYGELTYLDNPISNMAGSAILGWPFRELLGSSAWINLVIVAVAVAVMGWTLGARVSAFVSLMTVSSLGFSASVVVGGDYFTTAALLAVAAWWFRTARSGSWQEYAAAALLAVVGTTRVHLLLVVALVAIIAVSRKGPRSLPATGLLVTVAAALSLMWFVPDPSGFTPLGTADIAGGSLPVIALAATALALAALAATRRIDVEHLWIVGVAIVAIEAVWEPSQVYRGTSFALFAIPLLVSAIDSRRDASSRKARAAGSRTFSLPQRATQRG